jgi:hypothetical protein
MTTSREQAIAAAIAAAKQAEQNKALDIKSKGAADAERNSYQPPSAQQGFDYDIMYYQAGWLSTGRNLPEGVQQIRQPSTLGFRSSCRDLQDIMSNIENQETQDDTPPFNLPREIRQAILSGTLGASLDDKFRPLIPSYDPNTGATVASDEASEFEENTTNEQDSNLNQIIQANILEATESPFLNLGRTATIIDKSDYSLPIDNVDKEYNNIEKSLVRDHVKNFNSSFYVLNNNSNLEFYKTSTKRKKTYLKLLDTFNNSTNLATLNSSSVETYLFKFDRHLRTKESTKRHQFKRSFMLGGVFSGSINGQKKEKFNFQKLVDESVDLYDNTFSLQLPFENSELLNSLNLIGASIVDVKENYNFYIKEYEKIATNNYSRSKENVFPLANLDGTIEGGQNFFLNRTEKVIFGIKDSIGEYFDLFGLNYENLLNNSNSLHNSYNNKLNNIIFLSDVTSNLNEISKKKYMFPMSVELSIPCDKTTTVTKILMDSELIDSFMMKLCDLYLSSSFASKDSIITETIFSQNITSNNTQTQIQQTFSSKRKNINSINISDLLENITQNPINLNNSNYTVIGDTTKYMRTNTNSMSFVSGLRNIIFNSKLNTFVRNNYRTYKDILNAKKCYNETLAFRVSKYEVGNNSPIQNYWIPNNPDIDLLNIVDTQVKYEKEYTYKIFAYQFVLGNKINQKYNSSGTSDNTFKIEVENLPEANLIEVEILSTIKKVSDTPPLSPEVVFVPYFGVDNKIGLFLNGRTGEEKLETINILDSDQEITSLYKKNLNNTVLYKSDDIAKRFEIMKLDRKPNSYADFSKGFIKVVNTDVDPSTPQEASAATFIDTIEPNKKYYYCFRTVDTHEKISNPTQIFELEMINEKGMVFPIIKNYEFEKPSYSNAKEMRRFIKIKPASQHILMNREISQIDGDTTAQQSLQKINLGLSDVAVPWGKTFKMVVTSKQTGKKCEFKFKFKYKTE